jgi:medium-chain acyl-[acyl-carrier-protein] hydrolase
MTIAATERWFAGRTPNAQARVRLFCFPYAGAGASVFRSWGGGCGPDIEVCPVQLPGRETRHHEQSLRSFAELIPAVAAGLEPWLDRPFALFGHSLGGVVAYEMARWFEATLGRSPAHLFISARRAPHVPDSLTPLSNLSDEAFLSAVTARYDGIPQLVLESAELMALLLPRLRADFELLEAWRHVDGGPLGCPISVFGGHGDTTVAPADLEAWRRHTTGRYERTMVPGPHLFLQEQRQAILSAIGKNLGCGAPADVRAAV